MSSELTLEPSERTQKEWALHNGVVVLVAVVFLGLSVAVDSLRFASILEGAPEWVFSIVGQSSGLFLLAAGALIGMLVGTRLLQAHVGPRGARLLALWGVAAIAIGIVLQTVLFRIVAQNSMPGVEVLITFPLYDGLLSFFATAVNVGAAMLALAFVARIRRTGPAGPHA